MFRAVTPARHSSREDACGIRFSGLSRHCPLCKPEISTGEGPKPKWTTPEEDRVLTRYVLHEAATLAEPRGILIGLDRIHRLVDSPAIGINFDTGNSYLCGHDPYVWLRRVAEHLVHLHAKDISVQQSGAESGKVTGTPVGCACGEGVIDWKQTITIVREHAPRDIEFSVECGTGEQARRSAAHLKPLMR